MIRAEDEILLSCARASTGSEGAARTRALLQKEIDWERLLERASRHGLMPLLYRHLKAACAEAVPGALMARLCAHHDSNLRRNVFLAGELFRILALFEVNGIPAIPLKGLALAASIYNDLGFRQFTDLDLLVQREDVLKARDLLLSLGYRSQFELEGLRAKPFLDSQCQLLFSRKEGRLLLDLHWALAPRYFVFPQDPRDLWHRRDPGAKSRFGFQTLSPEDTLLFLCLHGAGHLWERLIWISDLARLIDADRGMDWRWVTEEARTLGAGRVLSLGLLLTRDLFATALPPEAAENMEGDRMVRKLSRQVEMWLFEWDGPPDPLERFLFHLRMRERRQDRVRYCVRLAGRLSSRDRLLPLPSFLSPLHYLLRSARLAGKYGLARISQSLRRIDPW